MIEVYALVSVALLAAGAVVGFLTLICVEIHREEAAHKRKKSMSDRLANGARTVNGFHKRDYLLVGQEVE